MNSKYIKAELAATKFKQSSSVVQGIIDELGGCDRFAAANKETWAAAFNKRHPVVPGKKPWGFGKGTEDACAYAKNIILGRTDKARLEEKISEETERSRDARDKATAAVAIAEYMDSTRIQLKTMADAISWLSQIESEDSLAGVMNAYRKLLERKEA